MLFSANKILIIFSFLLLSGTGFSQDVVSTYNKPITAASADEDLAAFIAQFETSNVGNLHLYAKSTKEPVADYYYQGSELGSGFDKYLTADLRAASNVNAVLAIRYNDQNNLFIINQDNQYAANKLSLYRMDGTQLILIQDLSFLKKSWTGNYRQRDTWIQDVDGDTLLDLIQKERKINRSGKSKKVKTKIYLQQRDGTFELSNNTNVNSDNYIFENVK